MKENPVSTARLLVVSRESAVLSSLWSVAEPYSWKIETAASAWDAIERVQSGTAPHLLLLDFPRGDSDSLQILRWMRRLQPNLPVIVICSPEDAGREKEATRLGANEVLMKPCDELQLASAIRRHLATSDDRQAEVASENIEQVGPESFFVSSSPATQKLRAQAELLAEADVPVLILGENGSGKDTVARLIHKHSVRSGFHFLRVNCVDMPADLLGAELFGSDKNSDLRTGAGKIERAEKGTIFLDEITELPLSVQLRLMNVLQDKVWWRPGNEKASAVDVRILAATSASIERALADKKLREDFYYRLSAFTVQVPSLRQRKSEIPVLLQHAMHRLAKHYGLPPRDFSPAVLSMCQQYLWPGNLKELESFTKRYLIAGDAESVLDDLKSNRIDFGNLGHPGSVSQTSTFRVGSSAEPSPSSPNSLKSLIQNVKSEAERNAIGSALRKTGWNRKAASRLLQVSYRTLLYKIDKYHMSDAETYISNLPVQRLPLDSAVSRTGKKEQ